MRANPCPESPTNLGDFDPYTCGDDLILPHVEYKARPSPPSPAPLATGAHDLHATACRLDPFRHVSQDALEMLNDASFKPPGLYDFNFVYGTSDAEDDCWTPPAYRSAGWRAAGCWAVVATCVALSLAAQRVELAGPR